MHYYKRNIGDYAKKAGKLSMLQHGAYTLLIDACYDRERFPTLEDAIEWAWADTPEQVAAVEFVLRKFFRLQDGVYVQDRITEELAAYKALSEVNSRIAKDREAQKKAQKSTKREPVVNEPAPNHKPLTINQEPLTIDIPMSPAKLPTCPTSLVIQSYHDHLPTLPTVRLQSESRTKAIGSFWKWVLTSKRADGTPRAENEDQALQWIGEYFNRANDNDFLMGRNAQSGKHANWKADFDFLLTEKGKRHVIEKTGG
jgi:uncharacterized protein YdaU (DUF1376 family)